MISISSPIVEYLPRLTCMQFTQPQFRVLLLSRSGGSCVDTIPHHGPQHHRHICK